MSQDMRDVLRILTAAGVALLLLMSGCTMRVACRGNDGTPVCTTAVEHGADCAAAVRACNGNEY